MSAIFFEMVRRIREKYRDEDVMRILVVEDRSEVARFIVKGLKEERYSVDLAETGDDALREARLTEYDAIVLDVMLPGKDGFEVTRRLREDGCRSAIIMLTAKDQIEDRVGGLDAGADDYLTKPFAFAELLARLRALLRRRRGDPVETSLQLTDLELDLIKHEVRRAGQRIELTAKEYAVLEYLMRNTNHIVTRTALIEHVWDMHFDSDTNLVDVYIRYLRRKIDDDFEPKLIHTVRGVGYVLKGK
jgi:heavy metal response regulator